MSIEGTAWIGCTNSDEWHPYLERIDRAFAAVMCGIGVHRLTRYHHPDEHRCWYCQRILA